MSGTLHRTWTCLLDIPSILGFEEGLVTINNDGHGLVLIDRQVAHAVTVRLFPVERL